MGKPSLESSQVDNVVRRMSGLGEPKLFRAEERKITIRYYDTRDGSAFDHLLVLFHGCGYTSQTFGAMVASFPRSIRIVAFDCRGHGGTFCDGVDDEEDLSLDTLVDDAVCFIRGIIGEGSDFALCGHSMGGVSRPRYS